MISAFVIRFLESIISKLATGEISLFWLVTVYVSEKTGLSLALSETPKTGFVPLRRRCTRMRKDRNIMNWLLIYSRPV